MCAECVSFDTVIVLKEQISLKACLQPPPQSPLNHSSKNSPNLNRYIIRCFRNTATLTPFSHCTKTDNMYKKENERTNRWKKHCFLKNKSLNFVWRGWFSVLLHLLLMQWKIQKKIYYRITVWLPTLQKRYDYYYYATKKHHHHRLRTLPWRWKKMYYYFYIYHSQ